MSSSLPRHPVIEGVRLLAIRALGSDELPDADRQDLVDLIGALPKDEALGDWAVQESWWIQVQYPVLEGGDPAGLAVAVRPTGVNVSLTEIYRSQYGSDSTTRELLSMCFAPDDEESRFEAAEGALSEMDVFLEHIGMIRRDNGYRFSVGRSA